MLLKFLSLNHCGGQKHGHWIKLRTVLAMLFIFPRTVKKAREIRMEETSQIYYMYHEKYFLKSEGEFQCKMYKAHAMCKIHNCIFSHEW